MAPRGINNMEEVNYKVTYKRNSLKVFLEQASKNCRSRNKYFMNLETEDASNISQVRNSLESLPSVGSHDRVRSQKTNSPTRKSNSKGGV